MCVGGPECLEACVSHLSRLLGYMDYTACQTRDPGLVHPCEFCFWMHAVVTYTGDKTQGARAQAGQAGARLGGESRENEERRQPGMEEVGGEGGGPLKLVLGDRHATKRNENGLAAELEMPRARTHGRAGAAWTEKRSMPGCLRVATLWRGRGAPAPALAPALGPAPALAPGGDAGGTSSAIFIRFYTSPSCARLCSRSSALALALACHTSAGDARNHALGLSCSFPLPIWEQRQDHAFLACRQTADLDPTAANGVSGVSTGDEPHHRRGAQV